MKRLIFVFVLALAIAPHIVSAQTPQVKYPSAEAFKTFPSYMYDLAKSAEKTAKLAEVSLASSLKALALTETELRKAIKGTDAGDLAFWLSSYLLDQQMVLRSGSTVIKVNVAVSQIYTLYHAKFPDDRHVDIYTKWLKEATAYEKTFPAVAGDEALIKLAIARTDELKKKW